MYFTRKKGGHFWPDFEDVHFRGDLRGQFSGQDVTKKRAADQQVDLVIETSEDLEERVRLFEGRTLTSASGRPKLFHGRRAVERQNGQAVRQLGQLNEGTCEFRKKEFFLHI